MEQQTTKAVTMDEQDRFSALLDSHRGILFKIANGYCRHGEDRADLIQDMIVQLWRAFPSYDETRAFSTWMYRIALNVAITFYRRDRLRQTLGVPLDDVVLELAASDRAFDEASDDLKVLREIIADLDPLNRALALLYLDGQENRQIAEILGITPTNVSTKLNRLKQTLKASFESRTQGELDDGH